MIWKFCEIWKILWEFASSWVKFCEILSHNVRYGMYEYISCLTVILSFCTDRSGQTGQSQIRLILMEPSGQGLHCLSFCMDLLDIYYPSLKLQYSHFRIITANFWCPNFPIFIASTYFLGFGVCPSPISSSGEILRRAGKDRKEESKTWAVSQEKGFSDTLNTHAQPLMSRRMTKPTK